MDLATVDGYNRRQEHGVAKQAQVKPKVPFFLALTSVIMSDLILVFGVYSGEGWQILGGLQKHAGQLDVLLQEILGGSGMSGRVGESTTRQGWTTYNRSTHPVPFRHSQPCLDCTVSAVQCPPQLECLSFASKCLNLLVSG